jgi:chromate transporter
MTDETHQAYPRPPRLRDLFTGFLKIGLMGFGGVGPIARHVIVIERRWLDDAGYAQLIGLCQAMPGANTVNAAVMIGDDRRGFAGALVGVIGLMAAPLCVLVLAALLYDRFGGQPTVQAALTGAAAAAAGLVLGTAIKLAARAGLAPAGWAVAGGAFAASALLHLPLVLALAALVPIGLLAALWAGRRG